MESKYFDNNMMGAIIKATIVNGNPYPGFSASSWNEIKESFKNNKINEDQLEILFHAIFRAFEADYNRHPEGTKIISEYLTKDKKVKTYPKAIVESISQLPDIKKVIHKFQIYFPLKDRGGITYFDDLIKEWCEENKINIESELTNTDNNNLNVELLSTKLNQVRMKAIHQYLSDGKYIDVDVDSWLYWFSLQTWTNKKKKPSIIRWTRAVYHLTNVVYLICDNMNIQTITAMKGAFNLKDIPKLTKQNIKGPFYNDLKKMIGWAEREIKDLH